MNASPEPPCAAEPAPSANPSPLLPDSRWRVRLVITIPVLLVLFTLLYGLVSYLSFARRWDRLLESGAGGVAGELLHVHLLAMVVLALLAIGMGVLLAVTVLRPIRAIEAAVRRVAEGRLDQPAEHPPAAAELDHVGQHFDQMMTRLRQSIAERDRHMMASLPIGALATDAADRITAASPQAARILGVAEEGLVGRTLAELTVLVPAASRELVTGVLHRLIDEAEAGDGGEFSFKSGDGSEIHVTSSWLRDSSQARRGRLLYLRDVAPVRGLSEHLSRTDQLAALGTFCLGLAHELRNPLGAIKGLSQLLQGEVALSPGGRDYISRMVREVDRIDQFVGRLLDLTEESSGLSRTAGVEEIIRQAREHVDREVEEARRATIVLQLVLGESLPALRVEVERVSQALAKLLQNAYEAAPAGGAVTLSADLVKRGGRDWCELRVHNRGSSIAAADRDRIFEPFFTTRSSHSGLGLTIARQIAAQNGGSLEVESGSDYVAFLMRLPVDPQAAGARP